MRYYSDELKKFYDKEEDLVKAETEAKEKKELTEVTRKELAKKVEQADSSIEIAYDNYNKAKEEVPKLVDETKTKINQIMEPARKQIEEAEHAKYEAIKEFNSKYGVYTATYTGDKAEQHYNKMIKHFNSVFENMWKPFSNWLW